MNYLNLQTYFKLIVAQISLCLGQGVYAQTRLTCHDVLITPAVKAMAWTRTDRLVSITDEHSPTFKSTMNMVDWPDERESLVVPLAEKFDAQLTAFGPHRVWLPSPLRAFFMNHGRFETVAKSNSPYSLWMIAPPGGQRGRTGVLLYRGRPVVIRDPATGAEYLLELKGAGLPAGGYAQTPKYKALQGGMWEQHATLEYTRLRYFETKRHSPGALGLGVLSFTGRHGTQETLIRLTPGNLRASFAIDGIERSAHQEHHLTQEMGTRIGELFANGYSASTHPENFIVDANSERLFLTDYLDVLPIWNIPQTNGFNDEVEGLRYGISVARITPGYYQGRGAAAFNAGLNQALGVAPVPKVEASSKDLLLSVEQLLSDGVAEKVLNLRIESSFDPILDTELIRLLDRACAVPSTADFSQLMEKDVFRRSIAESSARLNLSLSYQFNVNDPKAFLRANLPGLIELKAHLERENRLLVLARYRSATPEKWKPSMDYLNRLITWYDKVSAVGWHRRICGDRAEFLKLFYLPYHHGFESLEKHFD